MRLLTAICSLQQPGSQSEDTHVLRSEVTTFLEKDAIEMSLQPTVSQASTQSRPRPQTVWRPAAHPWSQAPEPHPRETAVQDDYIETDPLTNMPGDCFFSPWIWKTLTFTSRSQAIPPITGHSWDSPLRVWFINTQSCPLDCPWLPALLRSTWMRLFPLQDRWESAFSNSSTTGSFWPSQRWNCWPSLLLSHWEGLGLRVNFAKSALSPSQRISFLGTVFLDSAQMRAAVMPERTLAIQRLVDLLRNRSLSPSQIVSEDAEPRVFCVPSSTAGPASYAAPSALAETEGSIWNLVWQPLQSVDLESLSLKTALLLALASVKRMCGLQALSVISTCLQFGPNDTKVILKPRHGYIPKVLSTLFSDEDQELNLLCSVRMLKIYLECYALFRQSEQFFVCFDNRTKWRPVMKQRLSRWIFDAITLGYSSLGLHFPIGVRTHSTRVVASSWAWSSRASITEICAAAGWALPSTFARFYNL